MPEISEKEQELVKTIRKRHAYAMDKWRKNREDGQKNMRYVAGDPWDQSDKDARAGRPTVCPDELNQYVNQVVNTARQNPRGIKVDPAGDKATDELAQYRENRIRAIEYACNASTVYIQGLQGAVERNVGYWKVSRVYVSDDSDEQEIVILPVMNPDTILIDPDYKESDGSDIRYAFEMDWIPKDDFKRDYPNAKVSSFKAEDYGEDACLWCDDEKVMIVSYWVVETESKQVRSRTAKVRSVKQYVTNGLEILEEGDPQPGPYIPIVPVFGKELWVTWSGGGNAERVLLSLVTLARDPQKSLAYVMSAMLENMGQLPRTSFIGAVGQFETDEDAWKSSNTTYHPYLQYDPVTDASNGQPLGPPTRTPLTPDFQAYSTGVDVCRRAIMSAMGLQALPSAAQRANQKSGVALDKIESQQSIGSYHLIDHYDSAIKLTGRIINHWLSVTDVGEAEKPVREADGTHKVVKVNTEKPVMVDDHEYHFPIEDDKGRYQITISDGPSHESQREEASEFVSTLIQNLKDLPPPGSPAAKILALGIRLKQLGPIGDQMANLMDPKDNSQQQLGQMQAQIAQQGEAMQKMQEALQKLLLEKQGKVIEMQGKAHLAMLDHVAAMTEADKDRETKIAVAEIGTKAQDAAERKQSYDDLQAQFHQMAHETGMQAQDHAHEQTMGAQQAAQQSQLADQQGQQQSAQSAQEFEQQQAATPAEGESNA